ncbi:MAG: hypothetical protein JWO86_7668 [Myxococcaceae bacterium]|nr:hypothetical protein [Myxococcaceae bacterium]
MTASTKAKMPALPPRTATASLLYWLLVVCGLAGITLQRLDALDDVMLLWGGTVVGLALGQLVAWARLRVWVLAALGMTSLWLSPVFFIVFYNSVRGPAETCFYAFLPAAICGYLSLSERGALLAFWYPAVLWMMVVLDGAGAATFDTRTALPLVIGLGGLFIAYVRARETRRVALWRSHASVRLATPTTRAVLRASPLRAASQHAWTVLAGGAALVLTAWIAPHLWQTEQGKHSSAAAAATGASGTTGAASSATGGAQPCCSQSSLIDTKRVRVREYFPLVHGHDVGQELAAAPPCTTVCQEGEPSWTALSDDYEGFGTGGAGDGQSHSTGTSPPAYSYNNGGGPTTTARSPELAPVAITTATPAVTTTPFAAAPAQPEAPKAIAAAAAQTSAKTQGAAVTTSKPSTATTVVVLEPAAAAPVVTSTPPWKSALVLCSGVLALHLLVRAVRRKLTLRHLARPFWPETLDQRISNHWERILIGLRDAGIHTTNDEQPEALAKRVGIEGIETCATILERVRHGVRVDVDDLATMDAAAGTVYRAARQKAGLSARAAALVRWPLA